MPVPDVPGAEEAAPPATPVRRPRGPALPPLPTWKRLVLWVLGWFLVLLGLAGLVLPVLQGWLTLFLATAILSLVSEGIYKLLRRLFSRSPKSWRKVLRLRRWVHRRLHRESPGDGLDRGGDESDSS